MMHDYDDDDDDNDDDDIIMEHAAHTIFHILILNKSKVSMMG